MFCTNHDWKKSRPCGRCVNKLCHRLHSQYATTIRGVQCTLHIRCLYTQIWLSPPCTGFVCIWNKQLSYSLHNACLVWLNQTQVSITKTCCGLLNSRNYLTQNNTTTSWPKKNGTMQLTFDLSPAEKILILQPHSSVLIIYVFRTDRSRKYCVSNTNHYLETLYCMNTSSMHRLD